MKKYLPILFLFLQACSQVPQVLESDVFYKRDIEIQSGGAFQTGVAVVPFSESYNLIFKPKGEMDLMLVRTCHREFTAEKVASGWFSKKEFRYTYTPVKGIEDERVCPLKVEAYESDKGRHSWAFLDFSNPKYTIPVALTCNGNEGYFQGVGVCQARVGTIQKIKFQEDIRFSTPMPQDCAMPHKRDDAFEFAVTKGECLYQFDTKDGRLGRLTVVGYEGVLVREIQ